MKRSVARVLHLEILQLLQLFLCSGRELVVVLKSYAAALRIHLKIRLGSERFGKIEIFALEAAFDVLWEENVQIYIIRWSCPLLLPPDANERRLLPPHPLMSVLHPPRDSCGLEGLISSSRAPPRKGEH